ncbi:DsbA family protein [Paenirhodobacter populi]|uniref:DsbA family protein n=1 Tax=Paenirhodobacter populi TaxID=2306993 RepID=A0A443J2R1_9RHOB|nr:DsbA family protein [Sinirhodobacter populi]RWR10906.1 DsbA family protein [Sinirhodobacter populi]RWR14921.1 DsbA family protein [Sinirhodobacter populi]
MNRRSLLLGTAGAAALAVAGNWLVSRRTAGQTGFVTPAAAQDAGTILPDNVQGSENAPVTLIEYASFTCPHCAHFHETVYPGLKRDYIDTGKVRFILREVYFDKFGLWAGMVAQCGGAPKYYGISDMLFDGQRDWLGDMKDATVAANLRKIGLKAGLTNEQLDTCLNDQKRAEQMVYTFQQNAQKDAIDATPTLVINGEKHSNMGYPELKAILDAKLAG